LSLYQLQQFDAAIENLQRATQIYNDSINAHLWLGIALHRSGKLSQAETALTQANKLSKNESPEVHWQLARLYSDQKRYNEAANELELFLKNSPNSTETEKVKQTIIQLRQKAAAK
jgi:tetratricopeptide (TPR) repeat protein